MKIHNMKNLLTQTILTIMIAIITSFITVYILNNFFQVDLGSEVIFDNNISETVSEEKKYFDSGGYSLFTTVIQGKSILSVDSFYLPTGERVLTNTNGDVRYFNDKGDDITSEEWGDLYSKYFINNSN